MLPAGETGSDLAVGRVRLERTFSRDCWSSPRLARSPLRGDVEPRIFRPNFWFRLEPTQCGRTLECSTVQRVDFARVFLVPRARMHNAIFMHRARMAMTSFLLRVKSSLAATFWIISCACIRLSPSFLQSVALRTYGSAADMQSYRIRDSTTF